MGEKRTVTKVDKQKLLGGVIMTLGGAVLTLALTFLAALNWPVSAMCFPRLFNEAPAPRRTKSYLEFAGLPAPKYLGFICGQFVDGILSTQPITNGKEWERM